ncbi:hypothetical protein [Selenomonas sp. KH1T6]|uniref:hypothetical protein n=1 Tax=Selenomonas sp. KH1T6 TaxID=3158784 RepID=UPI0008A78283|nr:hypothetical protein SAMN05216583_11371 [Selenomonas ruminantium]
MSRRVYLFLYGIIALFFALMSQAYFENLPCFWNSTIFAATEEREIWVDLPEKMEWLEEHDQGWAVHQLKCDSLFVDAHTTSERKSARKEDMLEDRLETTLQRYRIKSPELTSKEEITVNDIPMEKYTITGTKEGEPFEIEAVTIDTDPNLYVFTYFYHEGSKQGKEMAEKSIESIRYKEKKS